MKRRMVNLLGLIILLAFCLGVGFIAKSFMKVDNLSNLEINISYQYLIFSILFSLVFAVSHCLSGLKTFFVVLIYTVIVTALVYFLPEKNHVHFWFFFPITIIATTAIFYFSWIRPLIKVMKALQFALLSALVYSFVIFQTFRIFGSGMPMSDFFIFLMDSLGFFVSISVGLSFGEIIFSWAKLKIYGEEISETDEDEFVEV